MKKRKFLCVAIILSVCQMGLAFASGVSSWMAVVGDAGLIGPRMHRLRKSIEREQIRSLIMPGDNLYFWTYPLTWSSWKRAGFQFDAVAIGNHNGGYSREIRYFSMPGEYYSVVKNEARFIVLNSDNIKNVTEQFEWLEREILSAHERLIFLVFHHPTFTVSSDHSWRDKEAFQTRMRSFLKEHGTRITALLLGHDHISSLLEFGSVPAVIAGSGREVRHAERIAYEDDGFRVQSRFLAPQTQHWVALEISDGAQEAWVHFIRVKDQKKVCSARLGAGKLELDASCDAL